MTKQQPGYVVKLFYSYCHKDCKHLDALEARMTPLEDNGSMEAWSDRRILAGEDIPRKIDPRIDRADIFVFLLSPSFLDSSECMKEWERAKELASRRPRQVRRIPVIVECCEWKELLGQDDNIKALPKDGKPVAKFDDAGVAWDQVYAGIEEVVQKVRKEMKFSIKREFKGLTEQDRVVFVYGSLLDPQSLAHTNQRTGGEKSARFAVRGCHNVRSQADERFRGATGSPLGGKVRLLRWD